MQVYIVFGLGFGDDESAWEVCKVFLVESDAAKFVADETAETGCEYKYEAFAAT